MIPALPTQRSACTVARERTPRRAIQGLRTPTPNEEQIMSGMLLFSPLTIRGVELRNRIVVPPMHQYSAVKGFPTDWHLMNAGKFAAGGAGLVVVESTKVERRGCGTVGDLGIWDDKFVEPLKRLVRFIKQQNSVAGIQLGLSGRKARATRPWEGDRPLQGNQIQLSGAAVGICEAPRRYHDHGGRPDHPWGPRPRDLAGTQGRTD